MSKSTIWISFDLGVRGDYESLYAWLDERGAKECVNNMALLVYTYTGDLRESLKKDLAESIDIDKRTRIYAIYRDAPTKKMKGFFAFGARRASPWTGYFQGGQREDDEV